MIHRIAISTIQAALKYFFCNFICCTCKSILFQSDGSINIYCNPNIFTTFLLLHTHWSRQGKKDNVPQFLRITA